MKLRTLWILILKIFGIYFTYEATMLLVFLLAPFGKNPLGFPGFMMFIAEVLFAYVFLFRADDIINRFRLEESIAEKEINTNIESRKIFRIAISVIGLFTLTDSVPEFLGNLSGGNMKFVLLSLLKVMIGFFLLIRNVEIEKWISVRQSD